MAGAVIARAATCAQPGRRLPDWADRAPRPQSKEGPDVLTHRRRRRVHPTPGAVPSDVIARQRMLTSSQCIECLELATICCLSIRFPRKTSVLTVPIGTPASRQSSSSRDRRSPHTSGACTSPQLRQPVTDQALALDAREEGPGVQCARRGQRSGDPRRTRRRCRQRFFTPTAGSSGDRSPPGGQSCRSTWKAGPAHRRAAGRGTLAERFPARDRQPPLGLPSPARLPCRPCVRRH